MFTQVKDFQSFEPWLDRAETKIDRGVIGFEAQKIPCQWYEGYEDNFCRMLDKFDERRKKLKAPVWRQHNIWRARGFFPSPTLKTDRKIGSQYMEAACLVTRVPAFQKVSPRKNADK